MSPERKRRPLSNFGKIAVPTETISETTRTGHAVPNQRLASVIPFLNQRLAHAKTMALDRRASIGARADLGELRYVLRELLRFLPRAPLGREIFAQSNVQTLREHLR